MLRFSKEISLIAICNFLIINSCKIWNLHDIRRFFQLDHCNSILRFFHSNSKYLGGKYNFGIETAVKSQKPLVVVNMNHERSLDIENCPMSLRGKFALHISNDSSIINFAIKEWPSYYKENKGKNLHSMYLDDTIYKHFNL